jgi:hypothetical protein
MRDGLFDAANLNSDCMAAGKNMEIAILFYLIIAGIIILVVGEIIAARNALLEMSEEIFAAPKSFVISEKRKHIEKMLKVI